MALSVWDYLLFRARTRPHDLAIYGPGGAVTYAQLVDDAAGLATELLARKFGQDDMIGLLMPSSYLHVLLILALDRLNVPSVSLASPSTDLAAVIRTCDLTAVIAAEPGPADAPCPWIRVSDQDRPRFGAPDRARLAAIPRPPDSLLRVGWSSGTSGGAKGSPVTRALQMRRIAISRSLRGYAPATRLLVAMGFPTIYGYASLVGVLCAGGTLVLPGQGDDLFMLARVAGVTAVGLNIPLLDKLVGLERNPLRHHEMLQIDIMGSHLPPKLAQEARYFLTPNLWSIYGTTEATTIAMGDAVRCIADAGTVGHLVPSIDAEIVDDADRPLAPGREGILRVRGPQLASGYHRNPEQTRRNFRDGWFYPGDVGALDAEGLLRITGRSDDTVRRGEEMISPLPLEAALAALPGVREVAVFPGPDAPELCAAVVLAPGARAEEIAAASEAGLAGAPAFRLLVVDALPRNANGKVLKRELAKLARRQSSSS